MQTLTIQCHLKSVSYSQAFRIKTICYTLIKCKKQFAILEQEYFNTEREHKHYVEDQTDKIDDTDSKDLLRKK